MDETPTVDAIHWLIPFSSWLDCVGAFNTPPLRPSHSNEMKEIRIFLISANSDHTKAVTLSAERKTKPVRKAASFPKGQIETSAGKSTIRQPPVRNNQRFREEKLSPRIWDMIPEIMEELGSSHNVVNKNIGTGNQSLYNQLETQKPGSTDQTRHIKVTGVYSDSVGLRIGDSCWIAPIKNIQDQFDSRIWMKDPNCPKRNKLSFITDP